MLLKLADFIKKNHKFILIICTFLTALSLFFISKLSLNTQLLDMLSANEPQIIAYKDTIKNFSGIDLITVAIEGDEDHIKAFILDTHQKLAQVKNVEQVIYKQETAFLKKHGLLLLKQKDFNALAPWLKANDLKDFIQGINDSFEKEYLETEDSHKLSKDKNKLLYFINYLENFLLSLKTQNISPEKTQKIANKFLVGPKFMLSPDHTLGLIFIKTPVDIANIQDLVPLVNTLENIVTKQATIHQVNAGLSGMHAIQRDEMRVTQADMQRSFILSLVLILTIFYLGFRLLRYTILSIIPLIVGVLWSLAITYLIFGSLNLFTAMLGAILIGLGIDYAIHIIAIYTEERHKGTPPHTALDMVFKKAIKGIITGSITTAIGFMMFSVSSFKGFREFGLTLGIGILCVLVASIFILPSLLILFGHKEVHKKSPLKFFQPIFQTVILKKPWFVVIIVTLLTIFSFYKFSDIKFSIDYKKLEPKGLEAIILSEKIIDKFNMNTDVTLGITRSLEASRKLADNADELHTVASVESIVNYLPTLPEQLARQNAFKKFLTQTKPKGHQSLSLSSLSKELQRLEKNLIELSDLAYIGAEQKLVRKCDNLLKTKIINNLIQTLPHQKQHLLAYQKLFISHLKQHLFNHNKNTIITKTLLPPSIKTNYIGKNGTYLTTIYPLKDVWDENFQAIYFKDIASLKNPLTGTSLLMAKVIQIAGSEGKKILILVVLVIYIVLLIDFRSFKYANLAMIPMSLTLVLMIGTMTLIKMPFDMMNIMALPIIIGIGVDDGVHLIHRYLLERKIIPSLMSTGRGIFLTTLTTMAAFGTMMTGSYRGFVSFGLLLIIGLGYAYLLTVFVLSSCLKIIDKVQE
jgi:predicted RND superfamily exporter protein